MSGLVVVQKRHLLMKSIVPVAAVCVFLAGCVSQPPPPPKPDPMIQMLKAAVTLGQMAQAGKQAPAIRADTSVLFPSRSQAVALGLLSFRGANTVWPAKKDALVEFFHKEYQEAAPPESELADLSLAPAPAGAICFSFVRPGIQNETYLLTPDGTISFALTIKPSPDELSAAQPTRPNSFAWGDFAARLFVELPMRLLLEGKR